ncbi:stalk domain-containing protein [Paenibacillus allorhizosphaerae]|uniref:3D (Asp-Asp-Asp) domain-containing protein n=1 Tax=Paenibacillus allorhizosphaerae TaxID=2849866 RepID=A0ABM8VJS2_9BACL|nr:stalk domain-containing protein [Paenibacillus allorhizosphaerae]CAG7645899.1 hypothetical protein PAECIP111802_03632 [Paenibacillus allorhizosphaerae]
MQLNIKGMFLACLFALPAVLPVCQKAEAAEPQRLAEDVKVQVNDSLVHFPDAQPFLDENHKLRVPARVVADKLGVQVQWEPAGSQIKVTLANGKKSISLTTGDNHISVDGKSTEIATPAELIDGKVYVPFRLLSDTFGYNSQWDNSNRIAILGTDGKYYAPAWYKPKEQPAAVSTLSSSAIPSYSKLIEAKATAYTASPSENGGNGPVDYMGNPLQLGTIAVDPNVIPLGTKVYIEGYNYDGLPSGGLYATASDIGGAIKGNKIDIFLPESRSKARMFGVQQVKIYVLGS